MTTEARTLTLLATSVDPPAICPACGAALPLDQPQCAACRYERALARWEREPLPRLRRAARAEGLTSVVVGALCAAPAAVLLVFGALRGATSALVLGLIALAIASLFVSLGVARLRAIGALARWSYRDEGIEVTSEVNAVTFALSVRGGREQRAFVVLDPQWAALDASDPCLDALLAWRAGGAIPDDPSSRAWFRRLARGALAFARLASVGAIQLVEHRSTIWSIREDGARTNNGSTSVSLVRGHSVVSDDPSWETERALLAAFERVLGADEASVAPTAEARHYREAQLRARSLREEDVDIVLAELVAPPEGALDRRSLREVLDQQRALELPSIEGGSAPSGSTLAALERDRALVASWIELLAYRVDEPYGDGYDGFDGYDD